jgi:AbrB family looped-hinge helix DNA binding protein
MKSVVSEKGQVTIPKKLRDRLGIRPGQVIDWEEVEGRLVGKRTADDYADRLRRVTGVLNLGMRTDDLMEELRGPRDLT